MHKSTIDWTDVYYFLQIVNNGSARSTAAALNVSHSTVTRRVESLESKLGTRVFKKGIAGYQLTEDGQILFEYAHLAAQQLDKAETLLKGRDTQFSGDIIVTTSDAIANNLLMPMVAEFCEQFSNIDIEVVLTSHALDIAREDIDIALRILPVTQMPPEPYVGRILAKVASCFYTTDEYLQAHSIEGDAPTARIMGWEKGVKFKEWLLDTPLSKLELVGRFNHSEMQVEAAKAGVGIAMLPCFIGDKVPQLRRVPNCEPAIRHDIWMLSLPEMRDVARLKAFRTLLVERFEQQRALLLGDSPNA